MQWSILIKLFIANFKGKVTIKSNYKYLQYILKENLLSATRTGEWIDVGGFPLPLTGDEFTITHKGTTWLFKRVDNFITRIIAYAALIISFLTFLFK
ncbi:hypothetical protein HB816_08605 [Listeria booriae]|uniref:hypothetical protein n=1 Tax=Listeria booriae TaxID=1552123 RepID=UPI001629E528|nr:hypothetical protein [Listeria booriae]MBC1230502.1 hypothetical protein [Listeria booriae]